MVMYLLMVSGLMNQSLSDLCSFGLEIVTVHRSLVINIVKVVEYEEFYYNNNFFDEDSL